VLDGDEKQKQVPRSAYPICDGAPKRSARDDKSKFFFDRKSVGWVEMKSEKQVPRSAYPICDGAPRRSARDDKSKYFVFGKELNA
jgi:hypothetical protein